VVIRPWHRSMNHNLLHCQPWNLWRNRRSSLCHPKTRTGFTLIELMVAMALTLFIMVILSQAFVTALETFSGMKAIGDMQQKLRTAEVMLRDDLSQDHLEGKRRLSDQTLVLNGPEIVAHHPQAGFFAVLRGSKIPTAVSTPPFPPYA